LHVAFLDELGWPHVDFETHVTDAFRDRDVGELRTILDAWRRLGVNGGYRVLAEKPIGFGGKGITHGVLAGLPFATVPV